MCSLSRTCELLSSETFAGGASSGTSRHTSVSCNSTADVASRERSVREPGDIQPGNKGPDADHVSAPSCSHTL